MNHRFQFKGRTIWFGVILLLISACNSTSNRANDVQPPPVNVPTVAAAAATPGTGVATPIIDAPTPGNEPTTSETPPESDQRPLLIFNISGGIVGFCDELSVSDRGEFTLVSCAQDEAITGMLDEADLLSIQQWSENLGDFQLIFEDNPGGADNLTRDLRFTGQGQIEVDDRQQQIIFDWISGLTARLRSPAPTELPTPEPVVADPAGLCPDLGRPALLTLDIERPNHLIALNPDNGNECEIGLAQPPFGRITAAGNAIYYAVFDEVAQQGVIWRIDRQGQQSQLDFTAIGMIEPQPFDFVVSEDGTKIAWAWTNIDLEADPPLYRNQLRMANIDGSRLVIVLDQAENTESRFVTLVRFALDNRSLFYAMQPDIGDLLFTGRYDSLYRAATTDGQPQLLYACAAESNPVCIGGIAPSGEVLTLVDPQAGTIELLNQDGALLNTLPLPATDFIERTSFGSNGNMAFISAVLGQAEQGGPTLPNPGYISFIAPPYIGLPKTLLADNSVGSLRGWLDETRLIFGAIDPNDGNAITSLVTTNGQVTAITPNIAVGILR